MVSAQQLEAVDPQTRQAVLALLSQLEAKDREISFKQTLIDKLTHEMAVLKRLKFAATSERFASTLAPEQKSLLDETLDTDLAELDQEMKKLGFGVDKGADENKDADEKRKPKRRALPAQLPRREIQHEPADTHCHCGCQMQRIGEDVSEKLDYQPGVFSVERHVRGKWACAATASALFRRPYPPTSSTRASRQRACWPMCWWPSSWTICLCTARSTSLSAPAW